MERSEVMRRVRSENTKPELVVRKLLTELGYHYRLHPKDIPGKPDIAFKGRKKAIFVHGCFWHRHNCKRGARVPKTNQAYWIKKIKGNVARDTKVLEEINSLGWSVLIVWECETHQQAALKNKIMRFMSENVA